MEGGADEEVNVKSCSSEGGAFQVDELVLAWYQHRLYEAKILKINNHSRSAEVHYCNWSKSFDEWLSVDKLVKNNEENQKIKDDMNMQDKIQMAMEKEKQKKAIQKSKPKTGKKQKVEEEEMPTPMKIDISSEKMAVNMKIKIPPSLMKQLIDDHESIAKLGKLLELPRDPNVNLVLSKYREHKVEKEEMSDTVAVIINQLCAYFDMACPLELLYDSERQQYKKDMAHNGLEPCEIYGAEHLLRLFLKLPEQLVNAAIEDEDEESLAEFEDIMADILKFLESNQVCFFRG